MKEHNTSRRGILKMFGASTGLAALTSAGLGLQYHWRHQYDDVIAAFTNDLKHQPGMERYPLVDADNAYIFSKAKATYGNEGVEPQVFSDGSLIMPFSTSVPLMDYFRAAVRGATFAFISNDDGISLVGVAPDQSITLGYKTGGHPVICLAIADKHIEQSQFVLIYSRDPEKPLKVRFEDSALRFGISPRLIAKHLIIDMTQNANPEDAMKFIPSGAHVTTFGKANGDVSDTMQYNLTAAQLTSMGKETFKKFVFSTLLPEQYAKEGVLKQDFRIEIDSLPPLQIPRAEQKKANGPSATELQAIGQWIDDTFQRIHELQSEQPTFRAREELKNGAPSLQEQTR